MPFSRLKRTVCINEKVVSFANHFIFDFPSSFIFKLLRYLAFIAENNSLNLLSNVNTLSVNKVDSEENSHFCAKK